LLVIFIKMYKIIIRLVFYFVFALVLTANLSASDILLHYNLQLAKENPKEEFPSEMIYFQNEFAYCTGDSKIAKKNNEAVKFMEDGKFLEATLLLEKLLRVDGLFFPVRYNLGISYLYLKNNQKSYNNLIRARGVLPELSRTYMHLGFLHERMKKNMIAIDYYRMAYRRDSKNLNALIRVGDIFFEKGQNNKALKYYNLSLKKNSHFANGLLGIAKILFKQEKFYKARVMLKKVDISKNYDKSYHYYYAECSYKLRDYKNAAENYKQLLLYPNDRFFISTSPAIIKHKVQMSNKFIQ